MILTKYLFDLGVRLTEFSVTVESVTLRFYCRTTCTISLSSILNMVFVALAIICNESLLGYLCWTNTTIILSVIPTWTN